MASYSSIDHPWVDSSRAPIYWMIPPAVIADADLDDLFEAQDRFYRALDHPIAWVAECDHVLSFNAKQRAMWAKAEKELSPFDERWNKGQAYVMTSSLGRGILRAVQWVQPPVYPYIVVAQTDEAFAWARTQLEPFVRSASGRPPGTMR